MFIANLNMSHTIESDRKDWISTQTFINKKKIIVLFFAWPWCFLEKAKYVFCHLQRTKRENIKPKTTSAANMIPTDNKTCKFKR